ncbi:MAG: discoidin domain-containing protein [Tepidisphaeraceae bacterium]|jgi:hypothetical protein
MKGIRLALVAGLAGLLVCAFQLRAAAPVQKVTLKVVKVDSEETAGEDGKGANAVDGDPETIWHTQWQDASPAHPHEIIIAIEPACSVKGLTYLPRSGEAENGDIKDYEVYVSTDGKDFGKAVKAGAFARGKGKKIAGFKPVKAAFIKLVAKSEINGQPWTSAAEIGIVQEGEKVAIDPVLSVVKADSEETAGEDGKAANAVDGDPATFWHTQWQDASPAHPHEIIIKLDPAMKIEGFTYLPRAEGDNGSIKDYEFYVSEDGKDFGKPVAKGAFENTKDKKTVKFEAKACGFVKLKALSEVNDNPWTSAAEITVIPAEQ